jgi:acylphosphatase
MNSVQKHLQIKVFGRVQGVFFRIMAQQIALNLKLTGFVRNESDSTVYIEAEGEFEQLKKFLLWCQTGPAGASVTQIQHRFSKLLKNFSQFMIER